MVVLIILFEIFLKGNLFLCSFIVDVGVFDLV